MENEKSSHIGEDGREITLRLTAEEIDGRKRKPKSARYVPEIKFSARTDMGRVRENNEDKFDFFIPDADETLEYRGMLFTVADGMGGHAAGQIASELALKQILRTYYEPSDLEPQDALRRAITEANSIVFDTAGSIAERAGMGATVTAAVLWGNRLIVGQVGDSRAYIACNSEKVLRRITQDHSWVSEQVRLGALSEEDARHSPFRNVITRALGTASEVEVDLFEEELHRKDIIILCTDGLHGMVSDADIAEIACSFGPSEAALKLVNRANENGGTDNITVVIIRVEELRKRGRSFLGAFVR